MAVAVARVHPLVGGRVVSATGLTAPRDRLIASRVRVLVEIAERYGELTDPLASGSGVRGTGELAGLSRHEPRCLIQKSSERRCTCAYRSVAEFGRLVGRLREEERRLWWHLDGWWLSADSRTVWLCPRCGVCHQPEHRHQSRRNAGKVVAVKCKRVLAWRRGVGARESLAKAAVEWMAREWGLESEPMLPDEFRAVA